MSITSKQDLQGARTPADLERKYSFGKSFAEAQGFSEEARRAAERAEQAADSFDKVFASDITMTGTLTNTVEGYIPPGDEELTTIDAHILGLELIPDDLIAYYDFNGDGVVDAKDARKAVRYKLGIDDFKEWSGAVTTTITLTIGLADPEKAIRFTGTNMWGREIEGYIGVNFTSVTNPQTEEKIAELETKIAELEDAVANLGG